MSAEDDNSMQIEQSEPTKEASGTGGSGNENFVVLDMAGDSEDSDKEGAKDTKSEKPPKASTSDGTVKTQTSDSSNKPSSGAPRMRKKPKAPVVDVNSLRKRKWQLKVYPLLADDLQLNYVSILCKLASESLLYIPSESRHGKAELYVATQKETAAIIGKLLRMGFQHQLLSIEVVRKDTGGKEDGDESKKECKAFLMFDKFLSKKIFDAKGEKGTLIEKTVTLNRLPKAATKDFIGALFPFATEIDIIESDDPEERKATVKCKTPVTSLLVYKSFKRLEINDVHVKLSVDDSVKAIRLPRNFFIPPTEKKDSGPPEMTDSLNQSSLPSKRPVMSSLNRRAQLIKKRAILTRKKPTRGQLLRSQRPGAPPEEVMDDMPPRLGGRDYPGGPGRRRLGDHPGDRRRERESLDRNRRRSGREDSQVTKEMLQLQNQLNQAIKNQIAMLSTAQGGGGPGGSLRGGPIEADSFGMSGSSHRTSLLGQGPRHFGGGDVPLGSGGRRMDQSDFGSHWSMDRGPRPDRAGDRPMGRQDRGRPDRMDRPGRMEGRGDRLDRGSRDRGADRGDRNSSTGDMGRPSGRSGHRQAPAFGATATEGAPRPPKGDRPHGGSGGLNSNHGSEPGRGSSRSGRGPDYTSSGRSGQRNESSYTSQGNTSGRYTDYSGQGQGENGAYYRRY